MALTLTRWIGAVAAICALITLNAVTREPAYSARPALPADSLRLRDLERRVGAASLRWEALARRDLALAQRGVSRAPATGGPTIVIDPLLPATHRSIIERAVQRQWSSLGIDSARIPVTVAIVIDTAISLDRLSAGRGQIAYDYMLPVSGDIAQPRECVAVVGLLSRTIVLAGTQRALAEAVAAPRVAAALVGPCAFAARFGAPGAEIDRWLRAHSYRFAAYPHWWTLPAMSADPGERWRLANAGVPAQNANLWLSPAALGCAAGHTAQCARSLASDDTMPDGGLLMMQRGRDQHWGAMSGGYLSDLATALGPERFQRFWQSELAPDAALRAVTGRTLDVWTHQWAVGLVGAQRVGPWLSVTEVLAALTASGLALLLTAWSWGRRQVR